HQGGVLGAAAAVVVAVDDGEAAVTPGEVAPTAGVVEPPDLAVAGVVLDRPPCRQGSAGEVLGDPVGGDPVARRRAGGGVDLQGHVVGRGAAPDGDLLG